MSKDPFEISQIDKLGGSQSASQLTSLGAVGQGSGAAASRAGGQAPGGSAVPLQDHVQFSDEAGEFDGPEFSGAVNFGAWTPQAAGSQAQQAAPAPADPQAPGMRAGAVHGPDGSSGLEPGMQPGGVHNASEQEKL